jgi:hypothetical protein
MQSSTSKRRNIPRSKRKCVKVSNGLQEKELTQPQNRDPQPWRNLFTAAHPRSSMSSSLRLP